MGGENSGHLLCLDKHTTGDAIVAALAVLRALNGQRDDARRRGGAGHALSAAAHQRPDAEGLRLEGQRARFARPRPARSAALGDGGRILLRPSGTEPVLRVMVEAADRADRGRVRAAGRRFDLGHVRGRRADATARPADAARYNAAMSAALARPPKPSAPPRSRRGSTRCAAPIPTTTSRRFAAAHALRARAAAMHRPRWRAARRSAPRGRRRSSPALKLDAATVRAALLLGLPAAKAFDAEDVAQQFGADVAHARRRRRAHGRDSRGACHRGRRGARRAGRATAQDAACDGRGHPRRADQARRADAGAALPRVRRGERSASRASARRARCRISSRRSPIASASGSSNGSSRT